MCRNTTNVEVREANVMNEKVKKYIEETQKEIDDAKRKEREIVLEELGLYTEGRVYADCDFSDYVSASRYGFDKIEKNNGEIKYYRTTGEKTYIEVSDEEYEQICVVKKQKEHLLEGNRCLAAEKTNEIGTSIEYEIYADRQTYSGSKAAKYMRCMMGLIWVVGLVVSLLEATKDSTQYRAKFDPSVFGFWIGAFLTSGILFYCLSEVIENINKIAHNTTCLRTMTIKQKR